MIEINASELSKYLKIPESIAKRKTTIPITSTVLLKSLDDGLEIISTNLDISYRAKADCSISKPIHLVVDCVKLSKLVSMFEGDIKLKQDKLGLVVSSGKNNYKFAGTPVENFPELKFEFNKLYELDSKIFRNLLKKTSYLVVDNPTKSMLEALKIDFDRESLSFTSSDSFRIARSIYKNKTGEEGGMASYSCPKAMLGFLQSLSGFSDTIAFGLLKGTISFQSGNVTMTTAGMAKPFPNVDQMFFGNEVDGLTFNRSDMMSALGRTALFSDEKSLVSAFKFSNDAVVISSATDEGEAEEVVEIKHNLPELNFTTSFKLNQFMDGLSSLDSSHVNFKFDSSYKKFDLSENDSDKTITSSYLLLPVING